MRPEAKRPLLIVRVILVFLSVFTKSQASSPFEAMNSAHLSMCQKDVSPSVQKRWRTMAFSSVSTGDSVTLHLVRCTGVWCHCLLRFDCLLDDSRIRLSDQALELLIRPQFTVVSNEGDFGFDSSRAPGSFELAANCIYSRRS